MTTATHFARISAQKDLILGVGTTEQEAHEDCSLSFWDQTPDEEIIPCTARFAEEARRVAKQGRDCYIDRSCVFPSPETPGGKLLDLCRATSSGDIVPL